MPMYDVDILKGGNTSLPDIAKAIERLNREIARILGTERLLLGADSVGSHALARDKTGAFHLVVNSTLTEIQESVERDLIVPIFMLNGWPMEMMPTARTETVRERDFGEVTAAIRDMAVSGAQLDPSDPVINEVRDMMGVSHAPDPDELDALIGRMAEPAGPGEDPEEMPEEGE